MKHSSIKFKLALSVIALFIFGSISICGWAMTQLLISRGVPTIWAYAIVPIGFGVFPAIILLSIKYVCDRIKLTD